MSGYISARILYCSVGIVVDNLLDCDDPDCCNTTSCIADPSCVVLPDPVDIVSNSTANATMSFFDTIQFLFASGLQQGYDAEGIDKSYVVFYLPVSV